MAEHNTLTGANLHEPKGAATATSGQVYVANGAGSGTWTNVSSLEAGVVGQTYVLTAVIADVSTAETVYIPVPYAGTVAKVTTVLEGAIATSDDTITVTNVGTGSMGTITITESGSAAGDIDTLTPASNNTVTADQAISIATDGASTSAQRLWVSIAITRS